MSVWLDRASAVAVLLVCGLAGVRFWPGEPTRPGADLGRALPAIGSPVEPVVGIDYSAAKATVILVLHSTCQYCTKSMPFYRTLAQNLRQGSIRLYTVSPEPKQTIDDYLRSHEVDGVVTASAPYTLFGLPGTPGILVVKPDSTLAGVWSGWLTAAGESEVLSLLKEFGAA